MKRLAILGSTGSIGRSALKLVDLYPDRFQVVSLAARNQHQLMQDQASRYRPAFIALQDFEAAAALRAAHLPGAEVQGGEAGVIRAATHPDVDIVVAGITGAAGLQPTYQAILAGKDVALANKETLVMAGDLIMSLVRARGTHLLPVDSEHSALHQCLRGAERNDVARLWLTASGGPFFRSGRDELASVRVEDALKHPTWRMGPKITVDSATMMNKGLEVIEAHHLFGMPPDQIAVTIHPQSVVHSMVEFIDGTVLAQMSITDMRSALLYALSYPERWPSKLPPLDLFSLGGLHFYPPDEEKFPCLRLAYEALRRGQTFPCALNAANEVAVEAFLAGRIGFKAIAELIEDVLSRHDPQPVDGMEAILQADRQARAAAERIVAGLPASK